MTLIEPGPIPKTFPLLCVVHVKREFEISPTFPRCHDLLLYQSISGNEICADESRRRPEMQFLCGFMPISCHYI